MRLLPVAKPLLPTAERLVPYLREIDASRIYTNHGPLSRRLEARLAEYAGAPSAEHVCVAANATAALTATLMALRAETGSFCMMPAWTFVASGHAVVQAGLVPWFVDVAFDDGALTPHAARRFAAQAPGHVGAVLAVSPFGAPVDAGGWAAFRQRTGIPVVIDAAAAVDSARASEIATVVSLHATKVLAAGEGAFVTWTDANGIAAIRQRINFGFAGTREAASPGINAKMSEYAAAVGLAAFDDWPVTRAAFRRVALAYRDAFRLTGDVALQRGYGKHWISSTTIVRVPPGSLAPIEHALAEHGIATRRWWGGGLAMQRAFAGYPRTALGATEALAESTLGLPCWVDLADTDAARIAAIVRSASSGSTLTQDTACAPTFHAV